MAARIVGVCGRWRRQHDPPGSLVAAALVAVLAAAGAGAAGVVDGYGMAAACGHNKIITEG